MLPVTASFLAAPQKARSLFAALQSRRAKVLISNVASEDEVVKLVSLGVDMVAMKRPEL